MDLETTAEPPLASPSPTFAPQLSTGALIQRSLSIWWKNLLRFAGFSLILFIPVVLVIGALVGVIAWQSLGGHGGSPGRSEVILVVGLGLVAIPFLLAATVVQVGGITYSAVQQVAGRPVRFGAMFSASFRRFFPLLGAGILAVLIIWGGFLLLIVPGVIFACALAPVIPALMAERLGPVEAIRRSWALTRGCRSSIFLAGLVLFLIQFGVNLVAAVLGIVPILGQLAGIAIQLLAMSLSLTLPAVAYHDLRVLKEGTPTEELARVFE